MLNKYIKPVLTEEYRIVCDTAISSDCWYCTNENSLGGVPASNVPTDIILKGKVIWQCGAFDDTVECRDTPYY